MGPWIEARLADEGWPAEDARVLSEARAALAQTLAEGRPADPKEK